MSQFKVSPVQSVPPDSVNYPGIISASADHPIRILASGTGSQTVIQRSALMSLRLIAVESGGLDKVHV